MVLLIDIGNTQIKTARFSGRKILPRKTPPVYPVTCKKIGDLLGDSSVCVCSSVVPEATKVLRKACRRKKIKFRLFGRKDIKEISIKYKNPEKIGSDRLATILGAATLSPAPFIVVDIGTAVTCELVNKRKEYIGGIIFPGVELCLKTLSEKTALLPAVKFKRVNGSIGRNTAECISKGIYNAITSGIEKSVNEFGHLAPGAAVFLTGGGAKYFRRGDFNFSFRKDELLVFRGLLQLYKNLYNKDL
ncbi:MAG: type III pantothenate kinase [bacterium]